MARVPVDVSSLRSMRQGTRVSARPVDTFTSIGNMVETNSKTQQIANALAQVQPSVARYFDQEFNQHKKDQENEGLKSYLEASPKEKAAFAKKIKSGEISEFESPFFIEGMSRGILRNKAREYGNSLIQDWNKNKMKNIPVNDFIAQHTSQFVKKNGLEVFDADVLNEEFYSRTASYNNQVNQRDFEHRIAKAKQDQLDILGEELVGHAQYAIGDNGQFLPETYVHHANETIQSYIDQGLDPKAALEQAIAQLKSIAVAENGENGEDIAWAIAHLKTRVGNYGETGSGALWLENFKDEMEAMNLAAQDKALVREDKLKQKESEVDFEMAMQHLNEQGAEWFETDDGVEFMERIRTNQKSLVWIDDLKRMIEEEENPPSDQEILSDLKIQATRGELSQEDVLNATGISFQDRADLMQYAQNAFRVRQADQTHSLGYFSSFVKEAVKDDAQDPLRALRGEPTDYEELRPWAEQLATDIYIEEIDRAEKEKLTTNELRENIKKRFEDARDQLATKRKDIDEASSAATAAAKLQATAEKLEGAGLDNPQDKAALTTLYGNAVDDMNDQQLSQAAKILQNRASSEPIPFVENPEDRQHNLDTVFEFKSDIEKVLSEWQSVVGSDKPLSSSTMWVIANEHGLTIDELDTRLTQIAAGLPQRNLFDIVAEGAAQAGKLYSEALTNSTGFQTGMNLGENTDLSGPISSVTDTIAQGAKTAGELATQNANNNPAFQTGLAVPDFVESEVDRVSKNVKEALPYLPFGDLILQMTDEQQSAFNELDAVTPIGKSPIFEQLNKIFKRDGIEDGGLVKELEGMSQVELVSELVGMGIDPDVAIKAAQTAIKVGTGGSGEPLRIKITEGWNQLSDNQKEALEQRAKDRAARKAAVAASNAIRDQALEDFKNTGNN